MSAEIRIKRGASLSLNVAFANTDGSAFALTGVTMTAMVRDAEEVLVATLTPVATSTPGQADIFVQDTSAWPVGLLRLDVFTQAPGGPQTISDTFGIYVDAAITQTLPQAPAYDPVTAMVDPPDPGGWDGA